MSSPRSDSWRTNDPIALVRFAMVAIRRTIDVNTKKGTIVTAEAALTTQMRFETPRVVPGSEVGAKNSNDAIATASAGIAVRRIDRMRRTSSHWK